MDLYAMATSVKVIKRKVMHSLNRQLRKPWDIAGSLLEDY